MKKIVKREVTASENFHVGLRPFQELITTRPIDEELFARLQYLSEIEEVGHEFVNLRTKLSDRELGSSFLHFRAFIRQAHTFYEAGKALSYRSSPLFFYYAFMNLAKAYLVLMNPDSVNAKVYHGLAYSIEAGRFEDQRVKAKGGIYSSLYKHVFGSEIPNDTSLNICRLLGYITDISYEYDLVGYGEPRVTPASLRICYNKKLKMSWPMLAVKEPVFFARYKKHFCSFLEYFEEIELTPQGAHDLFGIHPTLAKNHCFFQSRKEYPNLQDGNTALGEIVFDLSNEVLVSVKKVMTAAADYDLLFSRPLRVNLQLPMNEMMAAYAIMYYLGSLVRYQPAYLESLLDSKHAWIIERFATSCGLVLLRNFTSEIINEDLIYRY